jgi:H/ACA ribonucleoprotein complex subunit 3
MDIELCPYCGGKVKIPHPAKFSPDDKYIKYRIKNVRTAEKLSE